MAVFLVRSLLRFHPVNHLLIESIKCYRQILLKLFFFALDIIRSNGAHKCLKDCYLYIDFSDERYEIESILISMDKKLFVQTEMKASQENLTMIVFVSQS